MTPQVPEISREAIVTSIGVTIIQTLDAIATEMKLSDASVKELWSPFLAATTRMVKPADDMVEIFLSSSKIE